MSKEVASKNLENLRHSLAHLLAAAVIELWPETKHAIGPAIDTGFYFDFEFKEPITEADLPKIEARMRQILKTWDQFEKHALTAQEAQKEYPQNPYKRELIEEFSKDGEKVTFYKSGDYWDLCRGGHVESMKRVDPQAFKLTHLAGAYWRGDEKNQMLTRIYGAAFETKKELDNFLTLQEEARKRDHRKLGKDLDLFLFSDLVGPGLPLWTPRGTILRNLLDNFVWELRQERGYQLVDIPHLTKKDLYEKSGHWSKFGNELFRIKTREGHEFALKPMNCPHHTQIYARKQHSYRDLPQRYASTTKVYRDEQTGELAGLTRVRAITQDDAHVFCRESQIKEEAFKIWDIVETFYKTFGFDLKVRLSVHDPENMADYLGDKETWEKSVANLKDWLKERKADYFVGVGEAAFYGPKIDFIALDSLGRDWQVATLQIDRNMPNNFGLFCINEKGEKESVVMLHAAIMGALERFAAVLIEHLAGAFPTWLAPVQVVIIPISDNHKKYAQKVAEKLVQNGIRLELNDANETMGKRVREAELQKIPYVLVLGDQEEKDDSVAVRKQGQKEIKPQKLSAFITALVKEIRTKK
ncbi:MAG: threonine--tRNA ligase [Candidatus Yanofskybacteria bacterium CG10_big_fil_rev_8_21_14_0_10_46_23]|uniref:Threonine--tRNA ligase n=1 Tax=Candidatus Yanofskybacteria bacterium CG10_big_fil_rev_8_21_14_0_10_46_23 TaxID=1975098 RepID=A0A2H0R5Z7_9BACT|nr:MAG: threonine--tRNA ligase [Candidatus Yanofskybacteria bacterium CG10_big_fil_rev_8_21_14_0_10_46_23]